MDTPVMFVKPIEEVIPDPGIRLPWDPTPAVDPAYYAMPNIPDLKDTNPKLFEDFVSPLPTPAMKAEVAAQAAKEKAAAAKGAKKRERSETEEILAELQEQKRKISLLANKVAKAAPAATAERAGPTVRSKKALRKVHAKELFKLTEGYMPSNIYKGWPDWAIHVMRRHPKIGYSDKALSRMADDLSDWEDYADLPPFRPKSTDWRVRSSGFYEEYQPRLKENRATALDGLAQYQEHEGKAGSIPDYDNSIDCM